jgi:hypothetical protein
MSNNYGLNQTLEYCEVTLDSWDAGSYGGTSFGSDPGGLLKYSWPLFYFTSRQDTVAAFKIIQAEIPFVFDVINTNNNTFTFTDNGTPYTITITPGTYTGTTLAAELQTQLSAVSGGFTVTFNSSTIKFDFNRTGTGVWSLYFPNRQSAYSFLGFVPLVDYSNTGNSTITSATIAQVSGPYYLYINSRKIGSLINFNLADQSPQGGSGPQVCRIPINVQHGSVIFYTDPDPGKYFDFFAGQQFDAFDFYLTLGSDQSQIPLDMKGSPWSLKVALLSYRKASVEIYKKPGLNRSGVIKL